jgi:hypothetical protein
VRRTSTSAAAAAAATAAAATAAATATATATTATTAIMVKILKVFESLPVGQQKSTSTTPGAKQSHHERK